MERKERIFTIIPAIILIIQFLFHIEYLWHKMIQLFYAFEITDLLNICSYLIDVVAIVALFKCSKRLLSLFWLLRIVFSIYSLISFWHHSLVLSNCFSMFVEIMMYILTFSSILKLSRIRKDMLENTYYIPIVIFIIVKLNVIIQLSSGLSTIINYSL